VTPRPTHKVKLSRHKVFKGDMMTNHRRIYDLYIHRYIQRESFATTQRLHHCNSPHLDLFHFLRRLLFRQRSLNLSWTSCRECTIATKSVGVVRSNPARV
jgi:hypothetical protein